MQYKTYNITCFDFLFSETDRKFVSRGIFRTSVNLIIKGHWFIKPLLHILAACI